MHQNSLIRFGLLLSATGIIGFADSPAAPVPSAEAPSLEVMNVPAGVNASDSRNPLVSSARPSAARPDADVVYRSGYLLSSGRKSRQRQ